MKARHLSPAIAVATLLIAGCHPTGGEDPEAIAAARTEALEPREVQLITPEVREEKPTLELVGEVRPFDLVAISSELAGKVDKVLVEVGDRVRAGQPLVEIDRATFRLRLDQVEAEVAAARADLALAGKDLERKRDLLSDQTIPQAAFDQAKAAFDLATARVAAGEAAQALAARDFERSIVRAPAAGSITQRHVVAGQWADIGQALLVLAIGDKVKVAAEVPAAWAPRLSGLTGFDFAAGGSPTSRRARLYSIDPVVEKANRSFEVVGVVDNTDGALRAGMFANIVLEAPNTVRSLWLPASAIATSDLPKVMLAESGVVVERDIQTGRRDEGMVEVIEGLAGGEQIIADTAGLSRGQTVTITGGADRAGS